MASTETISQTSVETLYQQHGGTVVATQGSVETLYQQHGGTVVLASSAVEVLYQIPWPRKFGPRLQSGG